MRYHIKFQVAESVADTLARADGREIRLEEEPTLALALLLPEDGYSCEVIRGVPPGLAEFLAPLQRDGLCRMAPQPTSSGYWTIYMIDHHNNVICFLFPLFFPCSRLLPPSFSPLFCFLPRLAMMILKR